MPGLDIVPAGRLASPAPSASSAATGSEAPGPLASSLRRSVLVELRRGGPASPDRLAATLGVSRTGVLQQLRTLEAAHLVAHQTVRHGVGRPRHLYDVTPDAQDLFPTSYHGLAAGLIAAIASLGGDELVEAVFAARRRIAEERTRARLAERLPDGSPLPARIRELAVIQDEQGYLCEAVEGSDGTFLLRQHNCAILRVAAAAPAACRAELELFRSVLGAHVERESHIASGDRCCSYVIRPLPAEPGEPVRP